MELWDLNAGTSPCYFCVKTGSLKNGWWFPFAGLLFIPHISKRPTQKKTHAPVHLHPFGFPFLHLHCVHMHMCNVHGYTWTMVLPPRIPPRELVGGPPIPPLHERENGLHGLQYEQPGIRAAGHPSSRASEQPSGGAAEDEYYEPRVLVTKRTCLAIEASPPCSTFVESIMWSFSRRR